MQLSHSLHWDEQDQAANVKYFLEGTWQGSYGILMRLKYQGNKLTRRAKLLQTPHKYSSLQAKWFMPFKEKMWLKAEQ